MTFVPFAVGGEEIFEDKVGLATLSCPEGTFTNADVSPGLCVLIAETAVDFIGGIYDVQVSCGAEHRGAVINITVRQL